MSNREKIREYIGEQIAQADFRAQAYVFDDQNNKRPKRNIFSRINSHLNKFLDSNSAFRWVTLTGLRGAGKTTILYQLYYNKKNIDAYFLILSADEIVQTLRSSISEILEIFEEIIGRSITNLDKPLLLFVDEVQYDENWGITLKTIYDKSNKVFIFSTGSAAVLMNTNADIARRAIYEKIYPLSFTEFVKIKHNHSELKNLDKNLEDILFNSTKALDLFEKLSHETQKINKYYLNISRLDFENYLYYGSLPFMIALDNEAIVYDQISKSLERVISRDIPQVEGFATETINKIPAILYAVADMDAFNFSTLASRFNISRPKITEIFEVLEKTEILHRIYPYGSHFNQVTKKPSKYLFSSPAFRAMYYKTIGNTISGENARGKLLEDLVGMYLYRILSKDSNMSLVFDGASGGADFIVRNGNKKIVIEVGVNKKKNIQVIKTAKKVKADYGIIVSEKTKELEYNKENNIVKIPLKYFVLM